MTLYLIGIGLDDEKDITLKGLEIIKKCKYVYLETYTSRLNCSVKDLEELYNKKIILADRELVEKKADKELIEKARNEDVALLIIGDPMSATTHTDIILRAKKAKVGFEVTHNASVLTAIGDTGLELYKFGKTTSIPFPAKGYEPETPYDILKDNLKMGLHTLLLLDLRPDENRFMSVKEAIEYMLKIEEKRKEKVFTPETLCVGCARLGSKMQMIKAGSAKELLKKDFGKPVHCLIVPGKLHFIEEEAIH